MMNLFKYAFLSFLFLLAASNIVYADDFYYTGGTQYNPYNGYTVMSLPPPPPMNEVPFYVRDDYDDYLEDYYKCILGYEYKGMTCRYWRKYAEKNGLYQKTPPAVPQSVPNNQPQLSGQGANSGYMPMDNIENSTYTTDNSAAPVNSNIENSELHQKNKRQELVPYTPKH